MHKPLKTKWTYVNDSPIKTLDSCSASILLDDAVEGLRVLFGVDSRLVDAPVPSRIPEASLTIARFMLRPNFIPNWLELAGEAAGPERATPDYAPYLSSKLDRFQPVVPIVSRIARHSKATSAYAVSSLVEQGIFEAAILAFPPGLKHLDTWEDYSLSLRQCGGNIRVIPLIRFAKPPTVISILALLRPCGARDHLWLAWNKQEKLTPAKIRHRWNELSDADRQSKSPQSSDKIDHAEKGRQIVKKGLQLARREDNSLGKELRLSRLIK